MQRTSTVVEYILKIDSYTKWYNIIIQVRVE